MLWSVALLGFAVVRIYPVAIALLCYRSQRLSELANSVTAIGLTIPSFALVGLLIPLVGIGTVPAVVVVVFYAVLPILRNAVVATEDKRFFNHLGIDPRGGGQVMIRNRERQVGAAYAAAGGTKPLERLWAGDLVHEMQVDVDEARRHLVAFLVDHPDLIVHGDRPALR